MQEGLQQLGVSGNDTLRTLYPQQLQTKYGKLNIKVEQAEDSRTAKLFNCYTQFENPAKASACLDCNPFSGKWNFHVRVKNQEPEQVSESILKSISATMETA